MSQNDFRRETNYHSKFEKLNHSGHGICYNILYILIEFPAICDGLVERQLAHFDPKLDQHYKLFLLGGPAPVKSTDIGYSL